MSLLPFGSKVGDARDDAGNLLALALRGIFGHPVSGNFFAPADPHCFMALDVIKKARQGHSAGRMATNTAMEPNAHHLRVGYPLLPQEVEGVLEQTEEVVTAGKAVW